jgi:hypothetical protein
MRLTIPPYCGMTDFFDLGRQLANVGKHSYYANYIPSVLFKYAYCPWRPL